MTEHGTLYDAIGGAKTVHHIVESLYDHIAKDKRLIPIFPKDFTFTKQKQYWFLTQFFGGPNLYLENRGHPMLRRRHLEFEITDERKVAWLECMDKALDEANVEEPYRSVIFERLTMTAEHMVNSRQ